VFNGVLAGLLVGVCLAGCSSAPPVTFSRYQYSCCDASDVQRVWHPGETLTMHWTAQSAVTTDSTTQMLTLTASLSGPYADVNAVKGGGAASTTLRAAPLSVSNATASSPVSVIALPAGLAPGFYDLTGTVAAPGSQSGGSSIIQVAPAAT
jgi:hypothetical protein